VLIPEQPAAILSPQPRPTHSYRDHADWSHHRTHNPDIRDAQTRPSTFATPAAPPQEQTVTTRATGSFDVKLTPQATDTPTEGSPLGRLTIDKQFHGDLEGTSKGEMLTAGSTTIKNSAGYVAVERVTGTLHGKRGTFALQHSGVMTRGEGKLTITVVPDSGTGDLTGLAGTMTIDISNGQALLHVRVHARRTLSPGSCT
jgi:hypothetical protein